MFFPRERSLVTRESKELLVGCTVIYHPKLVVSFLPTTMWLQERAQVVVVFDSALCNPMHILNLV